MKNTWIGRLSPLVGSAVGLVAYALVRPRRQRAQGPQAEPRYQSEGSACFDMPVTPPSKEPPAKLERKWHETSHDAVEEASWESFPASDPPNWSATQTPKKTA